MPSAREVYGDGVQQPTEPKPVGLTRQFIEMYGSVPRIFRAPGRVNLIGEHTDYNDGFVMPAAVQFDCWVAASTRSDRRVRIYSVDFDEAAEFDLNTQPNGPKHWSVYIRGVAQVLEKAGYRLKGAEMMMSGEVPIGAGLSSSAALEVSSGLALARLSGHDIELRELALLAQQAEHEFVGTRCGIMDQFISTHGKAGHALLLDCRSLGFELLPLPASAAVVICNTMTKHDLAAGDYNLRRAQCEAGVRVLSSKVPNVRALRDISPDVLNRYRDLLDPVIFRRCRHVVSENERVLQAAAALQQRRDADFGELMLQSHRSLRDDYEVSSKELDAMVEIASLQEGCLGARMTGGGFGGCTVNLVDAGVVSRFRQEVARLYEEQCGLRPEIYVTQAANGIEEVDVARGSTPNKIQPVSRRNVFELAHTPHRRRNALTGDWVLVSPQRTDRPWQGQKEIARLPVQPHYDPTCYLCPGNERAGGLKNPAYTGTFVFENDYPALRPDSGQQEIDSASSDLLMAQSERGICRVMCFTPRHDLTLPTMESGELKQVINTWAEQTAELRALDFIQHVQIFENRGHAMGASNPHPHCQIWATESVPLESQKECSAQLEYRTRNSLCLLCDYASLESRLGERVVLENDGFLVVVPFWAVWPFETLVISKNHAGDLPSLNGRDRDALADVLRRLTSRYDNLFETPFPYSMGFHQSPSDGGSHHGAHLHAHFYPPLLRSATVRKFMVGFEMLGMPQRDITAESAAQRLRDTVEQPITGSAA